MKKIVDQDSITVNNVQPPSEMGLIFLQIVSYSVKYLKKRKTINSDYYMVLLNRLSAEVKKKRPYMQKKKVLFHQDNAPCHKFMKTMVKLNELSFQLLLRPSYSPDMDPSDYSLFSDLKKMLQGKRFSFNEEVIAEKEAYFKSKDESCYKKA